jgi:hypothetical protein
MNTKRAAAGGEFGANGEWYEGGKFINTVPENSKRNGTAKRGQGKQEIAPYVWEVAPEEGMISLYRQFAGVFGIVIDGVAVVRCSQHTMNYYGKNIDQINDMITRWNAGERWFKR